MSDPAADPDMQALREEIERLDQELLGLLQRRMELVERVATTKLRGAYPFRDPQREELVLQRIRHAATERGLDAHEVERLYRLVLAMSVAHQQAHVLGLPTAPLRVAYQGVEGSFSHLTAQGRYGGREGGALLTGCASFAEAVGQVRGGAADLALLPIENTTAGSIDETYDLLAEGDLAITAEVVSHVEHCLLAPAGARLEELRTVLSHPQALAQCQTFLRTLPGVTAQAEFDTAGAARKVAERGDPTVAAIASAAAARAYGLEVLRAGIQSQGGNFTRFVEVALEPASCPASAPCKTSLVVHLSDRPGALAEALGELARRRVNLTKLESRPILGQPWRYRFYLDLEGHAASEPVAAALEAIVARGAELRVLGTYPAG